MIIPITLNTPSSSSSSHSDSAPRLPSGLAKISNDEVVLIELQGFLDVEAHPPEERNGQFVGKLKVDESGKPSLVIGHHLLEGKIATLAKPLAIFHRVGGPALRIAGSSSSSSPALSTGNGKGKGKTSADGDGDDNTPRKRRRTSGGAATENDEDDDDDGMDIDMAIINRVSSNPKSTRTSQYFNSPEGGDDNGEGAGDVDGDGGGVPSWTILGIVKKKIIFSKRPMPISGIKKQG